MSGHEWEIALLILGAIFAAIVQTLFRRAEKTGERLGKIERWMDFERGRRVGEKEKERRVK